MGNIQKYDEFDYLDYKCHKRAIITELVVTSKVRSKCMGKILIKKLKIILEIKDVNMF